MTSRQFNRRADSRLPVRWKIPVQVAQWPALRTNAQDVSLGGMSVKVPEHVVRGDRIVFHFEGNKLEAEVCRLGVIDGDGERSAGLRWLGHTARRGAILRRLVASATA